MKTLRVLACLVCLVGCDAFQTGSLGDDREDLSDAGVGSPEQQSMADSGARDGGTKIPSEKDPPVARADAGDGDDGDKHDDDDDPDAGADAGSDAGTSLLCRLSPHECMEHGL
ncbi:MAG: hypothetical protein QM778_30500 [Myxococcales bacterium]